MLLKQSTAVTVVLGPFLDSTDGNTQETALTIAQVDIRVSKNGGAFAQTNNVAGATHMEKGNYSVPLDATDTNTLGAVRVHIHVTGALAVWVDEFQIVPANVWDSLVGNTDTLQADLTQLGGVAQSLTDLKDFADAGYDPATSKVQGVVLVDTTITNTDMVGTDNALLASSAPTNFSDLSISLTTGLVDITQTAADKVWSTATRTLTSFGTLVQDIWDKATSALTTVGSIGKLLVDNINATISSRSSHAAADIWSVVTRALTDKAGFQISGTKTTLDALNDLSVAEVNTEVDSALNTAIPGVPTADSINERIKAIDDKLPTNYIMGSAVQTDKDDEIDAILADVTGINGEAMRGTDNAALASVATEARLAELDAANIPTDLASIQTDTDAIEVDTQDIQSRLPAALISGKIDADATALSGSVAAADNLEASTEVLMTGAAIAGTLSTTQMTTDLIEDTDDHYNGRVIIWTSGVLLGQATDITDYTGASKLLTFTAVTEAPTAADTFVIV